MDLALTLQRLYDSEINVTITFGSSCAPGGGYMPNIKLTLTGEELRVLATLADNELFRMRFVDPRLPDYRIDPEVFRAAQSVTAKLSEIMKRERGLAPKPDLVRVNEE